MKAYASKERYFNKVGLNKLDKAVDRMIKENIETEELEEELFGDKEEGLTGVDRKDLRKMVREFNKKKDCKKIFQYWNDKLKKKDVPFYFREQPRMRDKMEKEESKEVYRLRKITVEPVIGNLKQNLGLREFLLRGLDKVKIEMNIVCIAHNLMKIWKMTAAKGC